MEESDIDFTAATTDTARASKSPCQEQVVDYTVLVAARPVAAHRFTKVVSPLHPPLAPGRLSGLQLPGSLEGRLRQHQDGAMARLLVVVGLVVDHVEELELVDAARRGHDAQPVAELLLLEELFGPARRSQPGNPQKQTTTPPPHTYRYLR